jgi:hypothetical protein
MIVGRLVGHKGIHRQRKVVAVFVLMTIRRVEVNDNDAVRQACRQRASHQREKRTSKTTDDLENLDSTSRSAKLKFRVAC